MKPLSIKHFPFTLLIVAIVLYLSFFTPPSTDLGKIPNFDKIVHIGMYALLSGIIWLEYLYHYRTQFRLKVILSIAWLAPVLLSGCIELGQAYLTNNRSGDWFDFLANLTGATLAALVGNYLVRPRMR